MLRALAKGGFTATIVVIVEFCLLGARQIVVSPTLDLTNDNLWKAPVWALILVPALAFCLMFFANLPHKDPETNTTTTINSDLT